MRGENFYSSIEVDASSIRVELEKAVFQIVN